MKCTTNPRQPGGGLHFKEEGFLKGGKRKPFYHNDKNGPHYHPGYPKFKHWHYFFEYLLLKLFYDENVNEDHLYE